MSRNDHAVNVHQIVVHPLARTKGFFICIGLAVCCNFLIMMTPVFLMRKPLTQPVQLGIQPQMLAMWLFAAIVVPYTAIFGTYFRIKRSQIRRKHALRYRRLQKICATSVGWSRLPHRCLELQMMGAYLMWLTYRRAIRKMPRGHIIICRMANTPRLRIPKPINVGFEPINLTAAKKADMAVIASLRDQSNDGPETEDEAKTIGQFVFDAFNSQSRIAKVLSMLLMSVFLYKVSDSTLALFKLWQSGKELPFGFAGKYVLLGAVPAVVIMLFAARNTLYLAPGIIAQRTSSVLHRNVTIRIFAPQNASLIVNTIPAPLFENDSDSPSDLLSDMSDVYIGGANRNSQNASTVPDVVIGAWLSSSTQPSEMQLLSTLEADRVIN